MQSRYAVTSAGTVHYVVAGSGEPLVLISSMLVTARSYTRLIDKLSESFRVHVVELPGSGWSARVDEPGSLGQYAGWLIEFMNAVGLWRAILVGHANSGAVAVRASLLAPERFSAVVLTESGAGAAYLELAFNALRHTRNFLSQVQWAGAIRLRSVANLVPSPTLLACEAAGNGVMDAAQAEALSCGHRFIAIAGKDRPEEFLRALNGFLRSVAADRSSASLDAS